MPQFSAPGLAELVEPLKAERQVAGSIPGAGPILRHLKKGVAFALPKARPSRGSDDNGEMAVT